MTVFRRQLGLIRSRPWLYAASMALGVIGEVLPVGAGLAMFALFRILPGRPPIGGLVIALLAVYLAMPLCRLAVLQVGELADTTIEYFASYTVRLGLLDAILRRPGARALPMTAGEAQTRFREDVDEVARWLLVPGRVVGAVVLAMVAVIVMASIDARITIAIVIPLLLIVLLVNQLGDRIERYRTATRAATGEVTGFIGEAMAAVESIQAGNASTRVIDRLDRLGAIRARHAVRERILAELVNSAQLGLVQIAVGAILLLNTDAMRAGRFTAADLVLFEYYLWFIRLLPDRLAQLLHGRRQVAVSLARIDELAGATYRPGAPASDAGAAAPVPFTSLEITDLTACAGEGGVRDVNLVLERGSFTAVVGKIGSGKTTLLRALLGLVPVERGEIRLNGRVVDSVSRAAAYTAQAPGLFDRSVRDNILLGQDDDDVFATATAAAMLDADLADGIISVETVIGPGGVALSGGQRHRVAVARMVASDADLWLLDDVSSALDAETTAALWQRLFAFADRTWLVVTHDHELLARADQIIVLDEGRIVARGTLAEIASDQLR